MTTTLSRRAFLTRSALIGCSAAASPMLTPVSFASAPWDTRLVVLILRGGMDGLDVVQPYGDPQFAGLRQSFGFDDTTALDLDGFFALHGALADLYPLWQRGELAFAHAVSTPYRDKRSHFDGQDMLEAGTVGRAGSSDGWLNRMLQHRPGVDAETAYAVGRDQMRVLLGPAPVAEWSPDASLAASPAALRLVTMAAQEDPLFRDAILEAIALSGSGEDRASSQGMTPPTTAADQHIGIAAFAAEKLRGDTRIASFSLNGWDTHADQATAIATPLGRLSDTILALRAGLGPDWSKTAIIAMTEFGRTARENGTKGTDHGTAGAVLLAGGAIRGGRVYGQWPGLAEADLYQGRDLMPTRDVRAIAGWLMRDLLGLPRAEIEQVIFPGLSLETNPGLIL
ncbi:DUF1501 domain-containing protein [Pseudoruegeria sp. SK021]|uniref:DUF1501 domain-containing protein n=1 Tax=Pseudoruegeria sp. SK021 TaxID=1933035 RepID=UPI000A24D86A|nr:DUF1501 domain-containing protein [Pseudoruegeria sp. SK021]OSP56492.1 twin-arginine translocation pathway signal [Pseudoruegeria sp. SK021]